MTWLFVPQLSAPATDATECEICARMKGAVAKAMAASLLSSPVVLLDPEVAWRLQQEQERGRAEARGVGLVLGTIGAAVAAGIVVTWAYHENGAAPFREDRGDVDISDRVCAEAVAAVLGGVR